MLFYKLLLYIKRLVIYNAKKLKKFVSSQLNLIMLFNLVLTYFYST